MVDSTNLNFWNLVKELLKHLHNIKTWARSAQIAEFAHTSWFTFWYHCSNSFGIIMLIIITQPEPKKAFCRTFDRFLERKKICSVLFACTYTTSQLLSKEETMNKLLLKKWLGKKYTFVKKSKSRLNNKLQQLLQCYVWNSKV